MDRPLLGKVALITAASRGIGAAIARRLGGDGANVVVNYHRNTTAAGEVVAAVEKTGAKAVAVKADMAEPSEIVALYDRTESQFGGLDIVVNNHANPRFAPLHQFTEDEYDAIFDLTAKGTFLSLREAARRIRDHGRIVNISAGGTVVGSPHGSVYHGAKAAVEQFTVALSKELGTRNVTVNAVLPGVTRTDGLIIPPALVDQLVGRTPLVRIGEPADIADVVAFLIGPDGRWLTGQLLRVAGGLI